MGPATRPRSKTRLGGWRPSAPRPRSQGCYGSGAHGGHITRVVADIDGQVDRLEGLRRIGIDEITDKRGHKSRGLSQPATEGGRAGTARERREHYRATSHPTWQVLTEKWSCEMDGIESFDTNGDGVPDFWRDDTNGDGRYDSAWSDADQNGRAEEYWLDSTGDGRYDTLHIDADQDGRVETVAYDTTGDGRFDTAYADTNRDGSLNARLHDTTGDGQLDTAYIDMTGDNQADVVRRDLNGDGNADVEQSLTSPVPNDRMGQLQWIRDNVPPERQEVLVNLIMGAENANHADIENWLRPWWAPGRW